MKLESRERRAGWAGPRRLEEGSSEERMWGAQKKDPMELRHWPLKRAPPGSAGSLGAHGRGYAERVPGPPSRECSSWCPYLLAGLMKLRGRCRHKSWKSRTSAGKCCPKSKQTVKITNATSQCSLIGSDWLANCRAEHSRRSGVRLEK